ncbi:MAG TPA: hypothetical protein PKH77_05760 [Anaerolineae bacterium]|nr:hypothetical protein [Anaerolineae bacterium]
MSAFTFTQLEEGEMLVIGPVAFSSSSSVSFSGGGGQQAQVSRANVRKIGITNRRVIVEQGDQPRDAQVISNAEVTRVYIRRERMGSKVEKIETRQGQTVKLDIAGLKPAEEARLFEIFPNAEIGEKKGLFGGFSKLAPQPVPAPRAPSAPRPPAPAKPASPVPPPSAWPARSHIDDPDIHSLDDLRRYYPLAPEYDYVQTDDGDYWVKRLSDGAQFALLVEEEMLGFDVPLQDPKRRKITIEVIKRK